jgi:ferric-chelate reductase
MVLLPTSHSLSIRFSPTKAQLALKAEQQAKYVKELWITIASVVAFLALIRVLRLLISFIPLSGRPKPVASEKASFETAQPGQTGRISWRRLPTAFASTFRVVAFRLNIPVGPGSVASVAELTFILGYIAIMLVLLLINSKLDMSPYEHDEP